MGHRAVVISAERYAQERQVGNWELPVPGIPAGEQVALIAATAPPVVFALGRAVRDGSVRYTRRLFDAPLPAAGLVDGPLTPDAFAELAAKAGPAAPTRTWLVGVDLPVEADSPAEAVRRYWSYLRDLGPGELPAYVAPIEDELAMQAYLLGEQAPLDPEEDQGR
jgi:hypothetical protein